MTLSVISLADKWQTFWCATGTMVYFFLYCYETDWETCYFSKHIFVLSATGNNRRTVQSVLAALVTMH